MPRFTKRTRIEARAGVVFSWHARPGAFERLTAPWDQTRILERTGGIEPGARVVIETRIGPATRRWVAEHREYVEGAYFRDAQVVGPFARWEHTHRTIADGAAASFLEDEVDYALPFGLVGRLLGRGFAGSKIEAVSRYRHRVTKDDIEGHARYGGRTMKIAVTGASGLIGTALVPFLTAAGHEVVRVTRGGTVAPGTVAWDPEAGTIDAAALEGVDAVVHLAGEPLVEGGRWSTEKKQRILESRRKGTRVLSEALAGLATKPSVLVSASAIGYYGDRGDEVLTEDSAPGDDFLAGVVKEWEAATEPARQAGIRVVSLRNGLVLSGAGGALKPLLLPFKMGVGGPTGNGNQYWSWVAIDDVLGAIEHAIHTETLSGPVNLVGPNPPTNREFTKTLGRVLRRPAFLPTPSFALRLMLGEVADALLFASQRVEPRKLQASGYHFRHPELEEALRHLLGKA